MLAYVQFCCVIETASGGVRQRTVKAIRTSSVLRETAVSFSRRMGRAIRSCNQGYESTQCYNGTIRLETGSA